MTDQIHSPSSPALSRSILTDKCLVKTADAYCCYVPYLDIFLYIFILDEREFISATLISSHYRIQYTYPRLSQECFSSTYKLSHSYS